MKLVERRARGRLSRKQGLLLLGLLYALLELGGWAGLAVLRARFGNTYAPIAAELNAEQRKDLMAFLDGEGNREAHDPVLGWTLSRDTNAQGMRDDHDYSAEPPEGVLRIAAFGDSFTYCSDSSSRIPGASNSRS